MSRRGYVTVTPELLAQTLFPGASVTIHRVAETVEDVSNGTYTVYMSCDQFSDVPEGCMSPRYTAQVARNEDGTSSTVFK